MPDTARIEASSTPTRARRCDIGPSDATSASSNAGRVGKISRHSISQPKVKTAPTIATRP